MKTKEQLYDELLIMKARDGEDEAFSELMSRWVHQLFYYVKRMVSKESDVEDILQNVWITLYRSLENINDISHYRVLLFTIARTKTIDYLRKEKRWKFRELSPKIIEDQIFKEESLHRIINAEQLHNALALVNTQERDILTLYYLQEFSTGEIAKIMRIPLGTVKSKLHYARKALQKVME